MTERVTKALETRQARIWLAFAAIYLIWGSTFLAIKFVIETIPPFLMGGLRFLVAGTVLFLVARLRGTATPGWTEIRIAAVLGALMIVVGNGFEYWAQQHVPSGLAAVLVASSPLWLVLLDWWTTGRPRLPGTTLAGLAFGFVGVVALTILGSGFAVANETSLMLISVGMIFLATLGWAIGSIYGRRVKLETSLTMLLALQMLLGGTMLLGVATATGEWTRFDISAISALSAGALAYLIFMGTLVAYSSYQWLMRVSEPAKVATHAYVNPIVALFLGWFIASEPLTPGMLVATGATLVGVGLINARNLRFLANAWRRFSTPKLTNNPELAMIARTWQGLVPTSKADAYYDYLKQTGLSAFDETEGNRGYYVLRKNEDAGTRFMILSLWESMDSVRKFAGDNTDAARFFPEDEAFLVEKETVAQHYEVLGPVQ